MHPLVIPLVQYVAFACGLIATRKLLMREPASRSALGILTVGYAVIAVLCFAISFPPTPFHDFRSAYWPAGHAVVTDPSKLRALMDQGVFGFVNMPIVAYLFAPLGMLPLQYAIAVFTTVGLILTVGAWVLLVRLNKLGRTERWLLAFIFAANGPLLNSIREGNTSHYALFTLVASLWLLRLRRPFAAGALLGATAIVKLPLLVFGIFFVLRRDWRGALGFGAVCAAAFGLSLAVFGWGFNRYWFEACVVQFSSRWVAAFNDQSIQGFILRLGAKPEHLWDWNAYIPTDGQRLAGTILIGLLFLTALVCCIGRPMRSVERLDIKSGLRQELQFLLVMCLSLVTSPLSWSHYYACLLIPVAFFLAADPPTRRGTAVRRLAWIAIFLVTPVVKPLVFPNAWLMGAYASVGVSTILFGGLLWLGLLAWWLARSGGVLSHRRPPPANSPNSLLSGCGVEDRGADQADCEPGQAGVCQPSGYRAVPQLGGLATPAPSVKSPP